MFADVSGGEKNPENFFSPFLMDWTAFVVAKTTDSSQRGRRFIVGNAGKAEGRTWL